jgi:hypothetical protein
MITGVSKAVVLVDDQDEARPVWSGQVGVDATRQGADGEERWIEVAPPARSLSLVLGGRGSRTPTATAPRQARPAALR